VERKREEGEEVGEGELRGYERGGGKLFYLTLCTRQVSEKLVADVMKKKEVEKL